MANVLSVVGYADSGKTTFLEGLLPVLRSRGLKVAVIKHSGHIDDSAEVGKDTWRLARAGAAPVGLVHGNRLSLELTFPTAPTPTEVGELLGDRVDLVITEGFKRADNPKLEVWRHADQAEPACLGDPNLIGVITCHECNLDLPVFRLDDYQAVAEYIISYFGLGQGRTK
ncbi:MAG: molybdopterin-guanine dinucleotide biosynthesis protein B [Firmicutes bacterium]|nr:molybdopterin-guanine dinucleotide biosynthesis protein B [Bacillota bacterium]